LLAAALTSEQRRIPASSHLDVVSEDWFVGPSDGFATCPITQSSLIRLLVREGQPASVARVSMIIV